MDEQQFVQLLESLLQRKHISVEFISRSSPRDPSEAGMDSTISMLSRAMLTIFPYS